MVWASNPARADLAYLTTVPRYFNIQMKANPKQNEVKLATQGTPREIGWGCGPLSKTLTLFMTKI